MCITLEAHMKNIRREKNIRITIKTLHLMDPLFSLQL